MTPLATIAPAIDAGPADRSPADGVGNQPGLARVLLIEPNAALRSAILDVLGAEEYHVETCQSLDQLLDRTEPGARVMALVAWQSMDGLLAEERRDNLAELTKRVRLVLMVPRRWARLLGQTDLGAYVAGLIPKPFEADELVLAVQRALA